MPWCMAFHGAAGEWQQPRVHFQFVENSNKLHSVNGKEKQSQTSQSLGATGHKKALATSADPCQKNESVRLSCYQAAAAINSDVCSSTESVLARLTCPLILVNGPIDRRCVIPLLRSSLHLNIDQVRWMTHFVSKTMRPTASAFELNATGV